MFLYLKWIKIVIFLPSMYSESTDWKMLKGGPPGGGIENVNEA